MELQQVTLNGFRRFANETKIFTVGKLVAFLGPNEAGKTSILKAIHSLNDTNPIEKQDLSRDVDIGSEQAVISARFKLEPSDLEAADIDVPTWVTLTKRKDGSRRFWFDPPVRKRDITNRARLLTTLSKVRQNRKLWGRLVEHDDETMGRFEEAQTVLGSTPETLSDEDIGKLSELIDFVRENTEGKDPKYFIGIPDQLNSQIGDEKRDTPHQFASSIILKRLPKILFFSNDDRLLEGSYDIDTLNDTIPAALDNLSKVANLSIKALVKAIKEKDSPMVAQLKEKANDELKSRFETTWSQSGVHVSFEVQGNEIEVLVREENYQFTKLAERSDGLRQFVALQSFTTRERAENPILLIDEAEIRLHYDAQADLIQMLSRQQVSPKIIYTTHSAGCLPEDLGNGVRLVEYVQSEGGTAHSTVKNQFWNRSEGGLEPLLYGMGAATLAFFPIRRALLTEGESDMLLLPTMLREAYDSDSLSFQIVPGLSKTSGINLPILARNGKGVAFIVDHDAGGIELEKKIIAAGFDKDAVFKLKGSKAQDYQLEDFVNPKILAQATQSAFAELGSTAEPIKHSDFGDNERLSQIRKHYNLDKQDPLPKVLIAYFALEIMARSPNETLLDAKKKSAFGKCANALKDYINQVEAT